MRQAIINAGRTTLTTAAAASTLNHGTGRTKAKRLAIIVSHPIQYYVPVFRALLSTESLEIRVFYTWSQTASGEHVDTGFGRVIKWDVPLRDGYDHEFVPNEARRPGTDHFWGLRNPGLIISVERWQPDAILVYGWNTWSHLNALRHFGGRLPVLFRGDSTLLDRRPPLKALARRLLLRWVYRHVDVALAVGSNNRDYFLWSGMRASKILIAPHSVDTDRFSRIDHQQAAQAHAWRRELGIDDNTVAIVFAGKLQWQKNPLLLLDAFVAADVSAHLIFVGEGELEAKLKAAAKAQKRIHFMPFQNQAVMPAVYLMSDLFVLPSRSETWGLSLNEAQATGRAIAASTQVGGARDLVNHQQNGWVFESGRLSELVCVLQEATSAGRERLHKMGKQGRKSVESWSTTESANRIREATLNLISEWHR